MQEKQIKAILTREIYFFEQKTIDIYCSRLTSV